MSKTITGSTNNQYWTYKLIATETATDTVNRTSTIKVEHYLGRKSGAGSSYFSGSLTFTTTINGTTQTTNKSMSSGTISSGGWKKIGEHTFTVNNTGNPTTINISGTQTSSDFTPSSSSASGTMDLTVLHLPPEFFQISTQEENINLINIGLPDDTLVSNLSEKTFTIEFNTFDGATITTYNVYLLNSLIGTSASNTVTCSIDNLRGENTLDFEAIDSMGGKTRVTVIFNVINYIPTSISSATTFIKRKTSSSIGLIDSKATLTLNGTYYNGDDIVGNSNTISVVKYKIWNTTEPTYIDITNQATIDVDTGSITISNYQIDNVDFDKKYNYKILIMDAMGYTDEYSGTVPTGIAVWTEYKDRVDFYNITKQDHEVFSNEYSNNEIVVGKWTDGKPIYRKVYETTTTSGDNQIAISNISSDIDTITKIDGTTVQSNDNIIPINYYHSSTDWANFYYKSSNPESIIIRCGSNYGYGSVRLIVEYTKTTD